MAEVARIGEVGPLARRGQLVQREIARVPHEAVAGDRKAPVRAVEIVEREAADLRRGPGEYLLRERDLLEQAVGLEGLERVHRGDPEDVGLRPRARLAQVGDRLVGLLLLDDHPDARRLLLEPLLVGFEQLLGKRCEDHHLLPGRLGRGDPDGGEEREQGNERARHADRPPGAGA
jgi:hypothetical protein